jgi:hypothetical protein
VTQTRSIFHLSFEILNFSFERIGALDPVATALGSDTARKMKNEKSNMENGKSR